MDIKDLYIYIPKSSVLPTLVIIVWQFLPVLFKAYCGCAIGMQSFTSLNRLVNS